ncbi:neutral zinc metallopeptidase [Occallatibacter savannae]|uniref:KPN_02809 family neutral zinc metallopeptidase n=1 Tax=Occallatibacter savannae TaxID=1002691 RepID=UPI000D68C854|nr:neutral zinc metallopeptidase [Occallatibacter savannae]
MEWQDNGISSDIEDRRGGGGGFGFGGGMGIGGFILLLILSVVTGRNFLSSGGGSSDAGPEPGPSAGPVEQSAGEERDVHLISFVLDDAQKTWSQIFAAHGREYRRAKLVLYRDITSSGCGTAQASTGPFYCPEDEKVYIDLGFWRDLKRFGGDTGDFAQAYVVAHELGHHIQKLLGIEQRMRRLASQDEGEQNPLSVDLELQADCFAGVWGHSTEQRNIVHEEDIAGALRAAAAVGDDHLQKMSGRAVSPESWTHGSSAQRQEWFKRGLDGGEVNSCPTFDGKLAP